MYQYCGKRAGHPAAYAGYGQIATAIYAAQAAALACGAYPNRTVKRGYILTCNPETKQWESKLDPKVKAQREREAAIRARALEEGRKSALQTSVASEKRLKAWHKLALGAASLLVIGLLYGKGTAKKWGWLYL